MRYSGRANWALALPLLTPSISAFIREEPSELVLLLLIGFGSVPFIIANKKNSVTIEQSKLVYDAHLFHWHVAHAEIKASDIRSMQFHLAGWIGRKAKVKGKYATFHYEFMNYKPVEFYKQLEQFAIRNNIPYEKTKDYKTVEKMATRS